MIPPPTPMRGPLLPPPPPARDRGAAAPAKPAAPDPDRAAQLITVGDRLLRAGNIKKADERYRKAMQAAPNKAAPQLRLALIASARGHYSEAADRLRDAETAEPGWLLTAPDVQSVFGEPREFLGQLARIEAHVHSHPDDRDAWLVLGGLWFLSGRTARAADVFVRLNDPDRKPDVALAAFLFAVNRPRPGAVEGGEPAPTSGQAVPTGSRSATEGR
jgi:tetratricopeptide (TPR) repeat protein